MAIRYRPEIDGLRTIAVGAVLIYHLDLYIGGSKLLQGGFLGVDIFFVISGFLITSLLHKEYTATGRVSIADFYDRRARRLLPALFVVVAVSTAVAHRMLVPTAMEDFARSALASIAFVSNIFWWAESTVYGARSGLIQPLLHTWSLAVEEQFYLVFPLIYIALLARAPRRIITVGVTTILISFALAWWLTQVAPSASFFLIFSRIWELLTGALLAHVLATRHGVARTLPLAGALPGLGLFVIAASLLAVPLGGHHPGPGTLGVVTGTVFIIAFARPGEPVTRLLSTRLFVSIGLISYALYLWHYPIYAFGRLWALMEPGPLDYLVWIALSFAAAGLTYHLIEKPFRDLSWLSRPTLAVTLTTAALGLGACAAVLIAQNGAPGRLERLTALYGPAEPDNTLLQRRSWSVLDNMALAKGYPASAQNAAHQAPAFEREALWFDPSVPGQKVLIIGNSHAKDLFNALHLNRAALPDLQFARYGMPASFDPSQIELLFAAPNFHHADTVVLSFRYQPSTMDHIAPLIERLQAAGKTVVLTTAATEFAKSDVFTIADRHLRRTGQLDVAAINTQAWQARAQAKTAGINTRLGHLAADYDLALLDKDDFLCNPAQKRCTNVTDAGQKALYDYGHYTLAGAAIFGKRIAETNWLAPLMTHR